MHHPGASRGVLNVIPRLTEPAPYLIRGNPVCFSEFRALGFWDFWQFRHSRHLRKFPGRYIDHVVMIGKGVFIPFGVLTG